MQNPAFLQASVRSSTCDGPSGQNATTAPPLPVNFDAAPTLLATSTISMLSEPRAASPNILLKQNQVIIFLCVY
ncbi:hypothetical protein Hanom_Chr17g01554701 [Helianthus anomalus]